MFDPQQIAGFVAERWRDSILPTLCEYIRIPNQSPAFDPDWSAHGHMERAVDLVVDWIRSQQLRDAQIEVIRLPGRTPLIFVEVAGSDETVLLYGHIDKQPPLASWAEGLDPWTPVVRDGRLYGRGAADDGYAVFAAVTAIAALQRHDVAHARCVLVIEACEESGSDDLPHYIRSLRERIAIPGLVIGLDSGCGDYQRFWMTTSLRGLVNGDLEVKVLSEGVHSGLGSGIVPSSFRIARQLLSRLEDERTGVIDLPEVQVDIPAERRSQAKIAAEILGATVYSEFPYAKPSGVPVLGDPSELLLNRTWRSQLEIIGAAGLTPLESAGNVLRSSTTLRLSLRLPPTAEPAATTAAVKRRLEADPPYGAEVRFSADHFGASGWNAPTTAPWLQAAIESASREFFGNEPAAIGEGGTIPFMAMLGQLFPQAQFVITGVLGPQSNAHGPNEFLELKTAERLTASVACILAAHHRAAAEVA